MKKLLKDFKIFTKIKNLDSLFRLEVAWRKLKRKKIAGVGCPGRSITLLAYCNITNQLIDYIAEQSSSLKLNMFTYSIPWLVQMKFI